MEMAEMLSVLNAKLVTKGLSIEQNIQCAIACDLLSWVMANARPNCAFVTIQTSLNTIAVASLIEMGCIIIAQNAAMEQTVIDKAQEEGILVIRSPLTTFDICGLLYKYGIRGIGRDDVIR